MIDRDKPVLSIGVVVAMTGLSERQIRYYESKGLIHPRRTEGNRRLYSEEHVEQLREIRELLQVGYTLKELPALMARNAEKARNKVRQPYRGDAGVRFPGAGRGQPALRIRSLYPPVGGMHLVDAVDEARSREARDAEHAPSGAAGKGEGRGNR